MNKVIELINLWREIGPVAWAESSHGWIDIDGRSITLERWQRAVLSNWWEHRDLVTTLAISNIKKTGKTFSNAVLLAWRWLALPGEHFAVGNDMDQSAGRQFLQIADMVNRNPFLRRNVKSTGKLLTFNPTGSTILALPVDAAGNAGANHLTSSHTESWGIIHEGGIRAFEELTPPPGRFYGLPAMRICDSYAGYEGDSTTWHKLVDRGLAGERVSEKWPIFRTGGILLFHMEGDEAQNRCFRGAPFEASGYYADQKSQLRNSAYLRLHENQRVTGTETFIQMEWWDACTDQSHRPSLLFSDDNYIYVGVDGAIKHDSAAVVAVTKDQDSGKVVLVRHRIWQPTAQDPLNLDETIGDFLRELNKGYRIEKILYDPFQLHDLSTRLRSDGINLDEFPQSMPNLTAMSQNLFELIQAGNFLLYPAEDLRTQVARTVAVESSRGWRITKEKSSHKIDAIIALAMASFAAIGSEPKINWEGFRDLGRLEDYRSPWTVGMEKDYVPPWHSNGY